MIEYFWSRKPGEFVDKVTGTVMGGAFFHGSIREWYETLIEVTIDVMNTIERKGHNKKDIVIEAAPDVEVIYQASVLYGAKIAGSFVLQPKVADDVPRDTVYFIDTTTGEIAGKIKVLGMEEGSSVWAHFKRLFAKADDDDRDPI